MAKLNNPFVVYGYKGPEYFCDREKETSKIMSTLHGERNVTLVAPRRMGKTGLIQHVFNRITEKDKDVHCFYIDIYATKNLSQLVQLLAEAIIGKLDTVSQSALRHVQAFFSSFRPSPCRQTTRKPLPKWLCCQRPFLCNVVEREIEFFMD